MWTSTKMCRGPRIAIRRPLSQRRRPARFGTEAFTGNGKLKSDKGAATRKKQQAPWRVAIHESPLDATILKQLCSAAKACKTGISADSHMTSELGTRLEHQCVGTPTCTLPLFALWFGMQIHALAKHKQKQKIQNDSPIQGRDRRRVFSFN